MAASTPSASRSEAWQQVMGRLDGAPSVPVALSLLALAGIVVVPAAAAVVAILALGPPRVPHASHVALIAAAALTIAEAAIAGLGAAALVEGAWRGSALPGSGPAVYLPWQVLRRRLARRRLANLVLRLRETSSGRLAALETLVLLAGTLDDARPYRRDLSERVARLASRAGARVGLSPAECERVRLAGLLHDIGNLCVPADLLDHAGTLTPDEQAVMARHATDGAMLVEPFAGPDVAEALAHHHEQFDGGGYPDGLTASALTAMAGLVAVADAYDALVTRRADHPACSRGDAFAALRAGAGTQFDPELVEALIAAEQSDAGAGPFAGVAALGSLGALLRRARGGVRGSPVPAAAAATACALIGAGLLGLVPGLEQGMFVAAGQDSSRIVVRTSPSPTPEADQARGATPGTTGRPGITPGSTGPRATGVPKIPVAAPTANPRHAASPSTTPSGGPTTGERVVTATSPVEIHVTMGATPGPDPGSPTPTPTPSASGSPAPGPATPEVDATVSANQTGAPTYAAPPISTAAGNELVLAFVSADGPPLPTQTVTSVSGGGLSWSLAVRANAAFGTAEVWQAHAPGPLASATITAQPSAGGYPGSITVAAFRNPAAGGAPTLGATASGAAAGGGPNVTLRTVAANSLVWATGHDWDHATARTPVAGQTMVHEYLQLQAGDTSWVQRGTPGAAAGASILVGDSAPTTDRWDLAAVEITPGP